MDWSELKGKWHQASGKLKKHFGKLTHDDVTASEGNREIMIGRLQARYGYSREVAERELSTFVNEHWTGMSNPASYQCRDNQPAEPVDDKAVAESRSPGANTEAEPRAKTGTTGRLA